jgi:Golgi phosphoprotein 3
MLHLYQEITLLALKDDKGTVANTFLAQALAGALASELILKERISISKDKKRLVDLLDHSPTGDALLDECIDRLRNGKRKARLQTWVSRFASIKRLHHKAADSLCDLGILKKETDKVLFIFNRTVYPERNPDPERQILQRLERALFDAPAKLSIEDTLLVSLAKAAGLLEQHFDKKRLKAQRDHIKQITEGQLAAQATREVIEAIQVAIIISAVIVPTVISN